MMHDSHLVVVLNVLLCIAEATCRWDVEHVRYWACLSQAFRHTFGVLLKTSMTFKYLCP
jgi:hypothetical protein